MRTTPECSPLLLRENMSFAVLHLHLTHGGDGILDGHGFHRRLRRLRLKHETLQHRRYGSSDHAASSCQTLHRGRERWSSRLFSRRLLKSLSLELDELRGFVDESSYTLYVVFCRWLWSVFLHPPRLLFHTMRLRRWCGEKGRRQCHWRLLWRPHYRQAHLFGMFRLCPGYDDWTTLSGKSCELRLVGVLRLLPCNHYDISCLARLHGVW
mmetsp:Transcript_37446/g.87910  ORF Transcript_37446/g.87910 Transcript_37446/m.87910 type:complete len:210 (+) Transcript_37446:1533-2162(+)